MFFFLTPGRCDAIENDTARPVRDTTVLQGLGVLVKHGMWGVGSTERCALVFGRAFFSGTTECGRELGVLFSRESMFGKQLK